MNRTPCTIAVVGTDSDSGHRWLRDRFPTAARQATTLLIRHPAAELDSILWAEALRSDASRAGHRLSIGLAERTRVATLDETVTSARRAFQRAVELGSDITISHSALLSAA